MPTGGTTPRATSPSKEKTVQFDLPPSADTTPDAVNPRKRRGANDSDYDESATETGYRHRSDDAQAKRTRSRSPASDSDETVDLPPRFDSDGQRKPEGGEDSFGDLLSGRGRAGKVFHRLTENLLMGGNSHSGSRRR
ncbi:hypothetical protein P152DRAFT_461898 [Eremomyces bilateralis CBS 781.70]|uniref:Uncharacterized protein n=1 Tax=Eremomyces bilateralis CBS 781.70 TaxID=1392243 RepID=A0A6G1FTE3_9PEZI|nr:uncharacterized protein P152DRAFT_461898 [Eremomyces bilateralis CBS 781.70]KAF1809033.1 hypothetical protein P152DRAFT_461898 [Eremomyces bilateralis CBS 781.70]